MLPVVSFAYGHAVYNNYVGYAWILECWTCSKVLEHDFNATSLVGFLLIRHMYCSYIDVFGCLEVVCFILVYNVIVAFGCRC
jgi:hypothetical protein